MSEKNKQPVHTAPVHNTTTSALVSAAVNASAEVLFGAGTDEL